MKPYQFIFVVAALAVPQFAMAEEEEDKPVQFGDLPASVSSVIKKEAGDAKLGDIVFGDEDGTPAYETTWQAGGHKHEIAVAKDGTVLSLEEIITAAEAPEAVQKAIAAEAGANKVLEVEKVLEKGKTHYEAEIQKGAGKSAVSFTAEGKVMEREEAGAEKGEKGGKEEKHGKDEEKEDDDDDAK